MTFWLVAIPVIVVVLGIPFLYDRRERARRLRLEEAPPGPVRPVPGLDPEAAMRYSQPHVG